MFLLGRCSAYQGFAFIFFAKRGLLLPQRGQDCSEVSCTSISFKWNFGVRDTTCFRPGSCGHTFLGLDAVVLICGGS
jgi:hypothetical protein